MDTRLQVRRRSLRPLLAIVLTLLAADAFAQTPISLFRNFVGNVNYQATGGSLRSAANTVNACSLDPSRTALLQGVPATATIRAAYLYWAGSGSSPDGTVTLNGTPVAADRVFTDTFTTGGTDYDFFAGFADVTGLVGGNGNYTFTGLAINNGAPYCAVQAVVAGWSLVVVYDDAGEDLRAVNIFDGFELFRASSLTLTVDTFRIPPSPINGKVTHVTFEGDPQNSGTMNGFSESLVFNGSTLDDGLVPPGSSPTTQQFDGTVNTLGVMTSHGVDVDTYDVSAFLSAGDTSASTTYSSGQDLVLLAAEVISFTTEPVVDLALSLSHSGDFMAGATESYTLAVTNNGPEPEANTITITDTLPAGLSFAGASGSGWICTNAGATVTCDLPGPLAVGATTPTLTISVDVDVSAAPGVTNVATVSSASLDATPGNDSASDPTVVIASDLSSSTKLVADLDGGDADPGDRLRYTIRLVESGGIAATGVRVTDDLPALTTGLTIVALPPGATDASTGAGTGSNGTGFLDIGDIAVPAGGSVDIVFEVTIAAGANPGDVIANQATVTNPVGIGAVATATNVIVAQSQIPAGGTKPLYLLDLATADPNGFDQGPRPYLSRTPPATPQTSVPVGRFAPLTWRLTPALQAPLTIDAGSIPVTLNLSKDTTSLWLVPRTLTVALASTGPGGGPIGAPVTQSFAAPSLNTPATLTFDISLATPVTVPVGSQLVLTLTNTSPGFGSQTILVHPVAGGVRSRIDLPALTVINVDSVATFDAAFPGGGPQSVFAPGTDISLRASVSDPFGVFDIASVTIEVADANGALLVSGQPMNPVAQTGGATADFEYLLALPPTAAPGSWTFRVTAVEGTEGTVTHARNGAFLVGGAQLMLTKSVASFSDPVNGTADPKAIPQATMLYTLTVTNLGALGTDPDTVEIVDRLPPLTALFVDTGAGDPIAFVDGTPASGLTFDFSTAVGFSSQPGGGPPYNYVPTPDANGFDPAVTGIRVAPAGAFSGSTSGPSPQFELRYRVRID